MHEQKSVSWADKNSSVTQQMQTDIASNRPEASH